MEGDRSWASPPWLCVRAGLRATPAGCSPGGWQVCVYMRVVPMLTLGPWAPGGCRTGLCGEEGWQAAFQAAEQFPVAMVTRHSSSQAYLELGLHSKASLPAFCCSFVLWLP